VSEADFGDDLEYEDLELVNTDGYRSRGKNTDTLFEPLKGRVKVGGPHGFRITQDRVANDEGLRKLIADKPDHFDFYKVHLGVSFVTHNGPRLESAQVKLFLTAVPQTAAPFALSITPAAAGTTVKVKRGVNADLKMQAPSAGEAGLGVNEAKEFDEVKLFVRGFGLDGDTPGWEFTRTTGQRLEGSCRLELIVQVRRGAKVTVIGAATAQATSGNLLGHFRADLPHPLTFTAQIESA
jgi:hypothetical protein